MQRLVYTLMLTSLLAGAPIGVRAQSAKRSTEQKPQSTKMIAFDDDKPEAKPESEKPKSEDESTPAPEAVAPNSAPAAASSAPARPIDPRRPVGAAVTATRSTLTARAGQVIPPPPRLALEASKTTSLVDRKMLADYSSKMAAATRLAVNSSYGVRHDPLTGASRMHTGVDIKASYGESVGSSMAGVVLWAGARGGYGNLVVVDHGGGISTYYAHLSAISVVVGQQVTAAELVGYVGSTGRSTGPHLHYEVRANGHPLNPFTTIAIGGGGLYVAGRAIADRVEPLSARALPLAPGGTSMSVSWDSDEIDTE